MGKIAIRGNQESGDKIIKYLEKLGGNNKYGAIGITDYLYYYIDKEFNINTCNWGDIKGLKYLLEIPKESNYELWD